jgi:predicted N-acetyltransferase YhbS
MQVKDDHIVKCGGARQPIAYISFLEVAPWNSRKAASKRFSGLGSMLVRLAIARSLRSGTEGRVGLHATVEAEGFYKKLGFKSIDCPNEYHE